MIKTRVRPGDMNECQLGDVLPMKMYALQHDVSINTALKFMHAKVAARTSGSGGVRTVGTAAAGLGDG